MTKKNNQYHLSGEAKGILLRDYFEGYWDNIGFVVDEVVKNLELNQRCSIIKEQISFTDDSPGGLVLSCKDCFFEALGDNNKYFDLMVEGCSGNYELIAEKIR